jgi:hypothetical protein
MKELRKECWEIYLEWKSNVVMKSHGGQDFDRNFYKCIN